MRISDYKCTKCEFVFEYCKDSDIDGFPNIVECEKCGEVAKRIWAIGDIDVAQGKLGRSLDGYTTGSVSHCSEYGRFKGTKIPKEKK